MANDDAEDDFLTFANPALVRCFEEAERTFTLDSSFLDSSTLAATQAQDDVGSDPEDQESDMESDGEMIPTKRTVDLTEDSVVEAFFKETCCCTLGLSNGPCSKALLRRFAVEYRNQCLEMSNAELDMVILGQLAALRRREPTIAMVSDQDREKKRRVTPRPYTVFRFGDMVICKSSFLFLHATTIKRFKNLCHHFDLNGLVPRTHGNAKRVPHNAFPLEVTKRVLDFIVNYAETHALPLPGRLPSHRDFQVMLLPTDTTKSKVFKEYKQACTIASLSCCSKSHFLALWRKQLPYICIMKPYTDLCDTCQQMSHSISLTANLPDEEKASKIKEFCNHLELAKAERKVYNEQCKSCHDQLPNDASGSIEEMHYSFDYAQQVHYPSSPQQPSSLYFKTARKCAVFGICCEPISKQVTYIIDEACATGKGADTVISYLHHFLEVHSQGETKLLLHADNCCGQNKNNALMQYLAWRTLTTQHKTIQISFMIPGHTKFAPDRFFGLFKKKFRMSNVDTMQDMARTVQSSTDKAINLPQPIVDPVSKQQLVHVYKWSAFLEQFFKPIPHILSYQVFHTSSLNPGTFLLQKHSSSPKEEVSILRDVDEAIPVGHLPEEISLKGLTLERQWYLYEQIREFCTTEEAADATCPKPSLPKQNQPTTTTSEPQPEPNGTGTSKRQRLCSVCRLPGHNKRSCPEK